eukprot:COSAG04_NODE_631_length_11736_cov_11.237690_9_plen_95_part_00
MPPWNAESATEVRPPRVSIVCVESSLRCAAGAAEQPEAALPSTTATTAAATASSRPSATVACMPRSSRMRRASSSASCSGVRKETPVPPGPGPP